MAPMYVRPKSKLWLQEGQVEISQELTLFIWVEQQVHGTVSKATFPKTTTRNIDRVVREFFKAYRCRIKLLRDCDGSIAFPLLLHPTRIQIKLVHSAGIPRCLIVLRWLRPWLIGIIFGHPKKRCACMFGFSASAAWATNLLLRSCCLLSLFIPTLHFLWWKCEAMTSKIALASGTLRRGSARARQTLYNSDRLSSLYH